jgi:hypothetical protein
MPCQYISPNAVPPNIPQSFPPLSFFQHVPFAYAMVRELMHMQTPQQTGRRRGGLCRGRGSYEGIRADALTPGERSLWLT